MKANWILFFITVFGINVFGQLERKPAIENLPVELTFHAPRHINLLTVEPLDKGTLHLAIMHTFGTVDGGISTLFGLDYGASIQLGVEYGISDKFSLGFSRSSRDRIYQIFGRYHLLSETQNGKIPVSVSLMGGAGTSTYFLNAPGNLERDFSQTLSYVGQLMVAKKISDRISAQVSPMVAYFPTALPSFYLEKEENLYVALGLSGKFRFTQKSSLTLQYIPSLNTDLAPNFGFGVDMEAGGHVFQMYLVTSQLLNEQYLLGGLNKYLRFGFNVNRVF
ncbi:MAG: hypothetical protein RJA52_1140 [Bacteroidota bacterium]